MPDEVIITPDEVKDDARWSINYYMPDEVKTKHSPTKMNFEYNDRRNKKIRIKVQLKWTELKVEL